MRKPRKICLHGWARPATAACPRKTCAPYFATSLPSAGHRRAIPPRRSRRIAEPQPVWTSAYHGHRLGGSPWRGRGNSGGGKGLLQVGDQVVGVFQAYRKPQQSGRRLAVFAFGGGAML